MGTGYWGPNLIRNFLALDEVESVIACDVDESRLARMRKLFYGIETSRVYNDIIDRPDIDIVAIATPVSTHYEIACPLAVARLDRHQQYHQGFLLCLPH